MSQVEFGQGNPEFPRQGRFLNRAWDFLRSGLAIPICASMKMTAFDSGALEGAIGAIPLIGDAFDGAWRANRRNIALLRDRLHVEDSEFRWQK